MKIRGLVVLLVMGGAVATAPAKNKKNAHLPQLFCQARSVYVQTVDGDPLRPQVVPEDRAAANALIAQLQGWKRYAVVTEPQQADLVWVVRAGRVAPLGAGNSGSNSGAANSDPSGMGANPGGPGMSRGGQGGMNGPGGPGSMSPSDSMDAGASGNRGAGGSAIGSPDDILAIYQRPNGGPLSSPLWQRNQHNGLESPRMPLFEQIRTAVDSTCGAPATAPPGQAATPPQ
ncbi:MAG TPA: hypothetical protein VMD92_01650 [Acidobacteriaceae bacterium]|nr:hypothetical protein [Acidobacteriaceae bacterium]